MKVYQAINAVQAGLAHDGITKNRKNQQQGYQFRGIDDVYNAISPLLAEHGLCILPRVLSRICVERETRNGGMLFNVTVEAEFDFVSAEDGSKHTVKTFGEAMDSADKATNKAMSAAYKYACLQTFAIPTEGDNDADAHTPPPVVVKAPAPLIPPTPLSENEIADWKAVIDGSATLEELKANHVKAYRIANGRSDTSAMATFTEAKDARKVALTKKPAPQAEPATAE